MMSLREILRNNLPFPRNLKLHRSKSAAAFQPKDKEVVMVCLHLYEAPELIGRPGRDGIHHPHFMSDEVAVNHHVPPLQFECEFGIAPGKADWELLCRRCKPKPRGDRLTYECFWDASMDAIRFVDFVNNTGRPENEPIREDWRHLL